MEILRKDSMIFDGISYGSWKEEEEKGIKSFSYWTCKEFGNFSSKSHKSKEKKEGPFFHDDEEFKESMEKLWNDRNYDELGLVEEEEVIEEIALVTIIDYNSGEEANPKTNHENIDFFFDNNNDL